jgi:hypothetical protein
MEQQRNGDFTNASPSKLAEIKNLRNRLTKPGQQESIGERLRRLNALIMLDLLQAAKTDLEGDCRDYFATLVESRLEKILLPGGAALVGAAASRHLYGGATTILDQWLGNLPQTTDTREEIAFAAEQAQAGHVWLATVLLDRLTNNIQTHPGLQYERAAVKCVATHKLISAVDDPATSKLAATRREVQLFLSAGVTIGQLRERLSKSMAAVETARKDLEHLTPFQEKLQKQISRFGKDTRSE